MLIKFDGECNLNKNLKKVEICRKVEDFHLWFIMNIYNRPGPNRTFSFNTWSGQ